MLKKCTIIGVLFKNKNKNNINVICIYFIFKNANCSIMK